MKNQFSQNPKIERRELMSDKKNPAMSGMNVLKIYWTEPIFFAELERNPVVQKDFMRPSGVST